MAKKGGKGRIWVPRNISSVAHPTRQAIIKNMEAGPKTAVDLEKELKESRYNLYHHLKTLKEDGFIKESLKGRMKVYELVSSKKPYEELTKDLDGIATVQQAIAQGGSGQQMAESGQSSMELEVSGDVLNPLMEEMGQKKVAKSKMFRVIIIPEVKKKSKKK